MIKNIIKEYIISKIIIKCINNNNKYFLWISFGKVNSKSWILNWKLVKIEF